jgi:hypothetical protein
MHGYKAKDECFRAKIIGVEDEGRIVMKKEDGTVVTFGFKEVSNLKM